MRVLAPWRRASPLLNEMSRFQQQMDRVLNRWSGDGGGLLPAVVAYPALNVWEDNESVHVEAELPGIKLEDLEISVSGRDQLLVKGSRELASPEQAACLLRERSFGSFERTIALATPVDPKQVEAKLENGVLSIQLAKDPAARPTRITVKGA
jgi:HSP20 family protein